jgi:hypothetical protein
MLLRETGAGRRNGGVRLLFLLLSMLLSKQTDDDLTPQTPLRNPDAPHHSLGDHSDDDDLDRRFSTTSSRRSSFERLDAQAAELLGDFDDPASPSSSPSPHHLHRESAGNKAHQHDGDRIEGLEGLLREDEEVAETERRMEEFERELEHGGGGKGGKDLLGRD